MLYKKTPKLRHRGRERFLNEGKWCMSKEKKEKIEEQRLLFHDTVFCNSYVTEQYLHLVAHYFKNLFI
jgi:hypothetical protein